MPIVAAIGGNAGNQTVTMVVRAIALGQVTTASYGRLVRKELSVAVVNGLVWGGLLGAVAGMLYQDVNLGIVMMAAMTLTFASVCESWCEHRIDSSLSNKTPRVWAPRGLRGVSAVTWWPVPA